MSVRAFLFLLLVAVSTWEVAGSNEEFPPIHLFRTGETFKDLKQKKKDSGEKNNLL